MMKIGLLGMGTIGSGVFELAGMQKSMQIKKVLERKSTAFYTTTHIEDIVQDQDIDLVVETMGGLHPAYEYALSVLNSGKHLVTANKLLVSAYGNELTNLAREKHKAFMYTAACGGGISFLANMEVARRVDTLTSLGGILNGTTNFILDAMQSGNMDYPEALKKAQELGYAEKDPSSDVKGLDTMRKLILACAVGLNAALSPESIPTYGISTVSKEDVAYAKKRELTLRLCAFAQRSKSGLCAYVEPTLFPASWPECTVKSNVNYIWYEGKSFGKMCYTGQGAGKFPTAANVLRDVQAVSAGHRYLTDPACHDEKNHCEEEKHEYYIRLPLNTDFPKNWERKYSKDNQFKYIETTAVSVRDMHAFLQKNPLAFAAGLA